ncbi:MAG TPA: hypothetical protein VHY48_13890 [Acidobacteriaceae bacterium]|jgi:hypothetical protein|nr:hypothetical protein [Acidobacteriaceae bacterium]
MGPRAQRPLVSTHSLAGVLLCGGGLLCVPYFCVSSGAAQVFTVGMKTATADVVTEFHPTRVELPNEPLDERGERELIRDLESEQGFAHRELPLGTGLTLVANGTMSPRGEDYKRMLYEKGESANPGDRVQVTALKFRDDRIVIDFNGGPYAKHRFLSHIELDGMQMAPQGPMATGCRVTLIFEGGIPEVTAAEVKALLDPVVDFRARSSAEAYADALPPKVREAIEAHEVLVGMNERMVLAAMGEPKTKDREHVVQGDEKSPMYEEWIYGQTPQPIQFVRFRDGHVVRLEIAALGKPVVVHDKNEIGGEPEPTLEARTIADGDAQPGPDGDRGRAKAPTLRKPGEVLPGTVAGMGKVILPADTPAQPAINQPATPGNQPAAPGSQPSQAGAPGGVNAPKSSTQQQLAAAR